MSSPDLFAKSGDSLREAFGKALTQAAKDRPEIVVLDADIAGGTGIHHFRAAYPDRFFQFGIAEQNMMSAAGGMAATGLIPFVTTFAVFCLRAFEQARLQGGYIQSNIKIVASHPGLDVGPDGGSAQALEDIAAFRAIPGMTVISPADPAEMALATQAVIDYAGPVYMRTGRSNCENVLPADYSFKIGKGRIIRDGNDVTLVACGVEVGRALDAAEILSKGGIDARVVNMATIKPIDRDLLARCSVETGAIVTAEDHNIHGGLGGAVAEALATTSPCPIEMIGVNDRFGESGEPDELAHAYGLTAPHIAEAARRVLNRKQFGAAA